MRRGLLFAALGAIVALLLVVTLSSNPLPKAPSPADVRAREAAASAESERQEAEMTKRLAITRKYEKLEEKKYKHWMKDEQGRMVPSEGYFAGDWFKKRRDGQAGIADAQARAAGPSRPQTHSAD